MSRDKQIEDMAKIICLPTANKGNCEKCGFKKHCSKFDDATDLYNAGYRKASDIFEEIEKRIATLEYRVNTPRKTVKVEELKAQVNWILHEVVPNTIAELIKTYESEVK